MSENKLCAFKDDLSSYITAEIPDCWPKILTEWSIAAIRTQPSDLLRWSIIYFGMKANGEQPLVKLYLDSPELMAGPGGLTPNNLKTLARSLPNKYETQEKIEVMWEMLSLERNIYFDIIQIGSFGKTIKPIEFVGIAAAFLNNRLRDTMIMLCHTLAKNDIPNGILLDDFVMIYQYLARLNCADEEASNKRLILDRNNGNFEEVSDDNQCFSYLNDGSSSDDFIDDLSCGSVVDEIVTEIFDTQSAEGIMFWQDDSMDESESLMEVSNKLKIEPPVNTTICDDPEFMMSLKKLRENADHVDLLSLLSSSSIISENNSSANSITSSLFDLEIQNDEIISEPSDEKMLISGYNSSLSLVLNDSDYNAENAYFHVNDVEIYDGIGEFSAEGIVPEETRGPSVETKYEDNTNGIDEHAEMDESGDRVELTGVEVNKDFIIMLAMVTQADNPSSVYEVEGDEDNRSEEDELEEEEELTESEFSLLQNASLDNVAPDRTYGEPTNDQTFEDNYRIGDDKESSKGDGTSSESGDFQYSELERLSIISVALEKVSSNQTEENSTYEPSTFETSSPSKVDGDQVDIDQSMLTDNESEFELLKMTEESEQNFTEPYEVSCINDLIYKIRN